EPPAPPPNIPPPPSAAPPPALPAPPPPIAAPPPSSTAPPPPLPGSDGRSPEGVAWLPAPPSGSARASAEDPQADRGVLAPTAYTHPKGTTYVSDYDFVFVQIGYAITDDTQISFTGFPPIDAAERFALVDVTLKSTLYRGGLVRVAALGSTSGIVAKQIGVLAVGRLGGVVQLCLERRCDSSLSLSSNVTLAGVMLMVNGATGIFRLGRTTSLLAELDTLVPLGKDTGELNGGMGGGGVRFHWTNWGLDLTLMRVLGSGAVTLPVLALTYRSAP
ncbi:MAG TPA: hypothetical protein VGK52_06730, partial [Polyangia bacterium]